MYNFVTLKQLRPKLPSIINDVDQHLGRYIIAKHGQAVAVLLSIVDFESLIDTAEANIWGQRLTFDIRASTAIVASYFFACLRAFWLTAE